MSPVQMWQDGQLRARWSGFLAREGLSAQSVMVEIMEGLLSQVESRTDETLSTLRSASIGILVDDFGIGYSSSAYLKRLDTDYLKIDRSFVYNPSFDEGNQALCEAMVALAYKLGLKVIVEGVEIAERRDFLKAADCDFTQGFLYSTPVPPHEFERRV